MPSEEHADATWQVARVTGIGAGELWFDQIEGGLSKREAQCKADNGENYIAIPENELPDDWGEQWLDGELESDPYAQ